MTVWSVSLSNTHIKIALGQVDGLSTKAVIVMNTWSCVCENSISDERKSTVEKSKSYEHRI